MADKSQLEAKYRGAVVEDLQLPPAFCLPDTAVLGQALSAAYEREFDYLPILNAHRKSIGYLDVRALKGKFERGEVGEDESIGKHTTLFPPFHPHPQPPSNPSSSSNPSTTSTSTTSRETTPTPAPAHRKKISYNIVTPLTPLSELEAFLEGNEFALVTDAGRRWVLAVATRGDLDTFVKRRGSFQF